MVSHFNAAIITVHTNIRYNWFFYGNNSLAYFATMPVMNRKRYITEKAIFILLAKVFLSLTNLSVSTCQIFEVVLYLWKRLECTWVEHLMVYHFQALNLLEKSRRIWKTFWNQHSSLFWTNISEGEKKFYNKGSRCYPVS